MGRSKIDIEKYDVLVDCRGIVRSVWNDFGLCYSHARGDYSSRV